MQPLAMFIKKIKYVYNACTPSSSVIFSINFFVLLELYLFFSNIIWLDLPFNILLFIFVLTPLPAKLSGLIIFKLAKFLVGCIFSLLLLWHQSWLPDIHETFMLVKEYGMPSFDYIFSFVMRVFSMSILFGLFFLIAASYMLRKMKLASLIGLPMVLIFAPIINDVFANESLNDVLIKLPEVEASEQMTPSEYLEEFYFEEAERAILFSTPNSQSPAFDIVVIQACSLSWHDLAEIGVNKEDNFFKQFDYLFSNFNSATSYSGPAMHRILMANCGQPSHDEIYENKQPKECQLFKSLSSVGFQTSITMGFNGYEGFRKAANSHMPKSATQISPESLEAQAIFYDGKTKLYNDFETLNLWHEYVKTSNPERAALYYNSILLHAGVRWVGEKTTRGRDLHEQFEDVFLVFKEDIQAFIKQLQASKRNTVLLFVPEHGRALVGNSIQLADIRDIPLPSITKVPVGVKLIGPNFKATPQQEITKPTSYLALSWLISKFMKNSPFEEGATTSSKLAARVPKTEHVSDNGQSTILEIGEKTLYRGKNGKWVSLSKDQK